MPRPIKKYVKKSDYEETDIRETVEDIRERLKGQQRTLIYALLAFGIVVIAVGGFYIYHSVSTSRAEELRYEGYKLFHGMTQAPFAAPAERYKSALEKFKESYATRKNPATLLYIANSHYELGNYDEAITTLKELTARYSDPRIMPLATYKLGMTYLKKGDVNNALTTFNNLAAIKDSPFQDMALLESGKILESMGKTEEAKAKYQELVNKFPRSAAVSEAKARLGS
ncbi:MAG: tetratricopeptide repeat protein [Nitrospirota bacterium]